MPQPPALIAITRLRRLVAALEAGEPLSPEDRAWLADRLSRYLDDAPRGLGLELALG